LLIATNDFKKGEGWCKWPKARIMSAKRRNVYPCLIGKQCRWFQKKHRNFDRHWHNQTIHGTHSTHLRTKNWNEGRQNRSNVFTLFISCSLLVLCGIL